MGDAWLPSGNTPVEETRAGRQAPDSLKADFLEPASGMTPGGYTAGNPAAAPWPARPEGAFYGPLGDAARLIDPLTEADPVAVLVQLLVAFGNVVGRGPRLMLGSVCQWANLFAVVVGKSSKSRKGTSWENASEVIGCTDKNWATDRIKSGLSTGEGIIHAVRDPLVIREAIRQGGKQPDRMVEYQEVEQDPGEPDKRLLVVEGEFARALKVAARKENILSAVLRAAWDKGDLGVMTRSPYKATGVHISLVGHITTDELRRELSASDSFNGFSNRFLWLCARRSKELPFGNKRIGDAAREVTAKLSAAAIQARGRGDAFVVGMDAPCRNRWLDIYSALSADRPGLVGSVLNRAETQVLRLALVYALADSEDTIRLPHLEAALALWDYSAQSALVIFGNALGNAVADEILRVLRESPDGMTRDEVRNHFDRNVPAARLTVALGMLADHGLARNQKEPRGGSPGRPTERWYAIAPNAKNAVNAVNAPIPEDFRVNGVYRVPAQEEPRDERPAKDDAPTDISHTAKAQS